MVRFHDGLSDLTVYLRYFHMMRLEQRMTERLRAMCVADPAREAVLVATARRRPQDGEWWGWRASSGPAGSTASSPSSSPTGSRGWGWAAR